MDMDNASFEDDFHTQMHKIFRKIEDEISLKTSGPHSIKDLNGNSVGSWSIVDD
jgi:hypothetical protein